MTKREDEQIAILSIYPDEVQLVETDYDLIHYKLILGEKKFIFVNIYVGPEYPAKEMPHVDFKDACDNFVKKAKTKLQELYMESKIDGHGCVILYEYIEFLKELAQEWFENEKQKVDYVKTKEEEEAQEVLPSFKIYHSDEPLIDRKSVFVAHLAKIDNVDQVNEFLRNLKSNPKIAKATHNIMAYRIKSTRDLSKLKVEMEKDYIVQDYDDDGETAAGGRLLKLLENSKYENVCVVVSRWYGGIKLGPDRFRYINNVAKDLLLKHHTSCS